MATEEKGGLGPVVETLGLAPLGQAALANEVPKLSVAEGGEKRPGLESLIPTATPIEIAMGKLSAAVIAANETPTRAAFMKIVRCGWEAVNLERRSIGLRTLPRPTKWLHLPLEAISQEESAAS